MDATDFINPFKFDKPIQEVIVEMTNEGVYYSFECIGSTLECCNKGWGKSIIIGVAGGGKELHTRPFQLVTDRVWKGLACGGVIGRTELPGMIEEFMNGKIDLDLFITNHLDFIDINEAFDLLSKGESIRIILPYGE